MANEQPNSDVSSESLLSTSANFPQNEELIIKRWRELGVYQESLKRRRESNKGSFVFYEGPPTANGIPHPGHCLTRPLS